jgi:bifunctional enzyme CysN/CysC
MQSATTIEKYAPRGHSEPIATEIPQCPGQSDRSDLLRFITCGSVDDGKSTLIGRLLHDTKMVFEDQLAAVEVDSRRWGTQGGDIDFALLLDGLSAEREQGITIDVAYRYFSCDRRKFIVADTPGHEQYTRNMITGASTADLALILVDARKGVLTQTRRHSHLVSLMGIRKVVLAVNKMDLVDWSADVFLRIDQHYRKYAELIGLTDIVSIPLSALKGDNIISPSERMPWYLGPTLLGHLGSVEVDDGALVRAPFRLPVQWVNRPTPDFRGFCGMVAGGSVRLGCRIRVQPSGRESRIARIVAMDGDRSGAVAGESVQLVLDDEIDISRGDVISAADAPAEVADQFECTIIWLADEPMLPGRSYLIKQGTSTVGASITACKHKIDVNSLKQLAARTLNLNEVGVATIALDRPIAFDPYTVNKQTGGFILIDRMTNGTVGAGMLHFALRRAHNIHRQYTEVNQAARAVLKGHQPMVLWFTGLSGAGKSTIANLVEVRLLELGFHSYLLDGDNLRHGLNRDLGFSESDRVENVRRVTELAHLMTDAGLIVLVALISPFCAEREAARIRLPKGRFVEIHVDAPLALAEKRDPKGLYRKARNGELRNFTGIDSPYEAPENPDLHLDTSVISPEQAAERVIKHLRELGVVH